MECHDRCGSPDSSQALAFGDPQQAGPHVSGLLVYRVSSLFGGEGRSAFGG
jgi:hypothetical protein